MPESGELNDNDQTRSHVVLVSGTIVGHYKIVEKIGAGGMGEVYLAEDTKLKRQVALKFMPLPYSTDPDARERFKREAQAAAVLNHPNIVTIHEVGKFHGRPYIVMEHYKGRSLRDYLIGKTLTMGQFLDLAVQILEGLHEAHAAGVIHRDLKPSNIMIDEYERPKLLDFGLATIRDREKLTKTGSTLGTIGYMSPEQISGKEVDERSDLFSLGVILYEMLARKRPFAGDNDAAVLNAVLNETPPPVTTYRPDVPDGVQRIIGRLLEKNPGYRFRSALEVLAELKHRRRTDGQQVLTGSLSGRQRLLFIGLPALVVLIMLIALSIQMYSPVVDETGEPDRKMLAVLPFENLGAPEDEYFADGITGEIISRLAALHGLGVISRTSTLQYKGTTKNLREIGAELGAQYILEGTIRWDKSGDQSRVRINPQLIQVANDVHLWADRFDAVINDIFAVQLDIAEKVATALDVTLLGSEREVLAQRPTENTVAYDYYLRGIQFYDITEKAMANQETMYLKAIELDSNFALAYARLGYTYLAMYWFYIDPTEERLALARKSIDKALALSPGLPQAHMTMGMYHYWGSLDYDRALLELDIAWQKQPNNSEILEAVGTIKRRQGNWDEGLDALREAVRLDPQSAWAVFTLGSTLMHLGEYAEAELLYDRAITLAPDLSPTYLFKTLLYLHWKGDTKAARRVLQEAYLRIEKTEMLAYIEVQLDIIDGNFEHAVQSLIDPDGKPYTMMQDSSDYYIVKGDIYRHMDMPGLMRACCDSVLAILEPKVSAHPEDTYLHSFLGSAYAGLGRKDEAIREGRRSVELVPIYKDAIECPEMIFHLAGIYTVVGEYDLAIDQLEYLLSIPSYHSAIYLKILPGFAPLRDHPRFQALLEKYPTNQR